MMRLVYLLLFTFQVQATLNNLSLVSATNHPLLALYDQQISSSVFGEPIFRLEPPNVINLINTKGATILCLASGSPRPKISWYSNFDPNQQQTGQFLANGQPDSSDNDGQRISDRPIGNVTNLRLISQNGAALRLLPFSEADYRQDIHSTEYKCVASNQVATIHSRSALVQAAISNGDDDGPSDNNVFDRHHDHETESESFDKQRTKQAFRVADEFVTLGSPAVLKCRQPNDDRPQSSSWSVKQNQLAFKRKENALAGPIEWFTSNGVRIQTGEINKGNKFTAFPTGELHLSSVEMADLRRTYGCRQSSAAMQIMSGQSTTRSSSGLAQLILLDRSQSTASHDSNQQPQVLHTVNQMIAFDSDYFNKQAKSVLTDQHPAASMGLDTSMPVTLEVEQLEMGSHNKPLLLPCAISNSFASGEQPELRWFFQASQSGLAGAKLAAPIPLDQWTGANSIPLIYIRQQNFTNKQSNRLKSAAPSQQPVNRILVGSTYLAIEWPVRANSGRYFAQLSGSSAQPRTFCDINVIIRQPIEASIELVDKQPSDAMALQNGDRPSNNWFGSSWFGSPRPPAEDVPMRLVRRHPSPQLPDRDPLQTNLQVQVRGRGVIKTPPMLLVGQTLQLECRAKGYPIDSLRWFRNGQPINTQSSSDFQVEIKPSQASNRLSLASSLVIRQLQPRDAGLTVFECFVYGSLGNEQVRSSQSVLILDRHQLESAQVRPPICSSDPMENRHDNNNDDNSLDEEEFWQPRGGNLEIPMASLLRRHNPFQETLLLESDPVELVCPQNSTSWWSSSSSSSSSSPNKSPAPSWYRASEQEEKVGRRNFNQLFSGDSRFVINGSSLQIRSPSRRHDESLYFCLASKTLQPAQIQPSSANTVGGLHQSSLAGCRLRQAKDSPSSSSSSGAAENSDEQPGSLQLPFGATSSLSSISIRIVAKPKIDPFEFSRNLEEGMRAGVLCAVISGQSPVDISWFKDGQPLEEDEQMSVDQSNGFSSTITFLRIKPAHSGLYTCVAANAFAATNHSSRLLVNVAPYFIEPPKSSKAILNTNVIVNCRAGGQPSPQIRWRKMVPVGSTNAGSRQVAPANGPSSSKFGSDDSELSQQTAPQDPNQDNNGKFEFRIVTSNSHIQVLENGSMIIKDVELSDASRYVCQAFNGINPSLSEVIDLSVLSPAQFDVNYETVSVRRESLIKFTCVPKGDQPMRIEWRKESNLLLAAGELNPSNLNQQQQVSKYTEVAYLANSLNATQQLSMRHSSLVLVSSSNQSSAKNHSTSTETGVRSSELYINFADRSDTGTFTCLASNLYGKDELTYRLIVQESPDPPMNVDVQNIQSNCLKLIWQAPFDGNLPIGHYVIEYRRVNVVSSHESPIGNKELASGGSSGIHNQREWQRTIVASGKLLATATGGSGSSSASSSSDLIVTQTNSSQQPQTLHSVVLRQLSAKTTYNIRMAAVNAIGQGSFSPHLTVTTAEDPPTSRPNDLRAQPISSSSIKVLWRGPSMIDEQAPIKGYYISHRKLATSAAGQQTSAPGPLKSQEQIEQQQPWISTFSISASNTTTANNLLGVESFTGRQPVDLANDLMVPLNGVKQLAARGGLTIDSYEFQLNSLERNTKYEIRVQPYNSVGVGPASETLGQTLKFDRPNQPVLRLVSAKRQSLELKWSLSGLSLVEKTGSKQVLASDLQPDASGGVSQPLMGFSLFYKYEYDEWQEIQLGVIYHYIIENLRCGNKYQIYLSAFNTVGRSDPSDVLNARTEGNTPIAPMDKSRFIQANISETVLDMSQWQSGGCPISSFMIQFKRLHDANWFILSEGSHQFASLDRVTIPDLVPATWYKLLVTAINEAGSTNAEYLFSTLSLSGESIGPPHLASEDLHHLAHQHPHQAGGWGLSGRSGSLLSSLSQLFGQHPSGHSSSSSSDGGFLLPMSCILLLVISSLAGYLYYSRASNNNNGGQLSGQPGSCSRKSIGHYCGSSDGSQGSRRNEKQLVSQSDSYQIQHNLLQSYPLDASLEAATVVLQQSPTNRHDNHYASSRKRQQHQQTMKLLPSVNLLLAANQQPNQSSSNCTSSSMSTNSTNCFDGSSSQGSTCGGQLIVQSNNNNQQCSGGAKAKLQLINESTLMSSSPSMMLENQANTSFVNESNRIYFHSNSTQNSPARNLYSIDRHHHHHLQQPQTQPQQHVDVIEPRVGLFDDQDLYSQTANHQRSILSSSFASAADLLQRQQQQQQQICDEPIYQRLDRFQTNKHCQSNAALAQLQKCSQTLRLNHNGAPANNYPLDSTFANKSLTLKRNQVPSAFSQQGHDFNLQPISSLDIVCPAAPTPLTFQSYHEQQQQTTELITNGFQECQLETSSHPELNQCKNC